MSLLISSSCVNSGFEQEKNKIFLEEKNNVNRLNFSFALKEEVSKIGKNIENAIKTHFSGFVIRFQQDEKRNRLISIKGKMSNTIIKFTIRKISLGLFAVLFSFEKVFV